MSAKKPKDEKIGNIAPFGLRMMPDLRERIEGAARDNNRSMNAEIVARLESTFDQWGPYTAIGMNAFVKRMETSLEMADSLVFALLYELRAAAGVDVTADTQISDAVMAYANEAHLSKAAAAQAILADWLREKGYLPK